MSLPHVLGFDAATEADDPQLGGKCASLARMIRSGAAVPPGFAVTTAAYAAMLAQGDLAAQVAAALRGVAVGDVVAQERAEAHIRTAFACHSLPAEVEDAIAFEYRALCRAEGHAFDDLPVAVRSSATAEDLPDASFAGQQDTYLWVVGTAAVVERVRDCWASLFTARAIGYRDDRRIAHADVQMAVGVQKMVNARAAGVAMTLDPVNGDRTRIVIDASWGLGEGVVSGEVTPDHFVVDKVLRAVVQRTISCKTHEVVPNVLARATQHRAVPAERQTVACLSDAQVLAVATLARQLEKQYGGPQDVEWAIEDHPAHPEGRLMLLQCRPETVWSRRQPATSASPAFAAGLGGLVANLLTPVRIQV